MKVARAARWRGLVLLAVALSLTVGCAGRWQLALLSGDLRGRSLETVVDSEPARRLLEEILDDRSRAPGLASLIVPAHEELPAADEATIRKLAEDVSLDFAALTFARAIAADPESRPIQSTFDRSIRDGAESTAEALLRSPGFPYTVLFAPSWMYRSHPATGADFAAPRRLLDRLAIPNRLIATGESASVEDNAAIIAAAVRAAGREAPLILVSASKSGAEAALALARLLAPDEASAVAGWVNIVGALNGSPLADSALRPPASWFVRALFWVRGWDWSGLASMATGRSRQRLQGARLPESIAVVNVVAVPVSGTVGLAVRGGYEVLREHGPNDGVVLLTDTLWPGGVNVVALGADHLYTPRKHDAHGLALMRAVDLAVRLHGAGRIRPVGHDHQARGRASEGRGLQPAPGAGRASEGRGVRPAPGGR